MRVAAFSELYRMDFGILRVLPIYQSWREGFVYTAPSDGRQDNALLFFTGSEAVYESACGESKTARLGDIVYIPQDCRYSCRFQNCRPNLASGEQGQSEPASTNLLINFTLVDENGERFRLSDSVEVMTPGDVKYYDGFFRQILALSRGGGLPSSRIKSLMYNLLTDLSLELRREDLSHGSFGAIYKAVNYMERYYAQDMDVASLAAMCGVSESCFRRLFKRFSGMSPMEYVHDLRISRARLLLESGALTVTETASALGFRDVSYFSRFYKRKTGVSPVESRKKRV